MAGYGPRFRLGGCIHCVYCDWNFSFRFIPYCKIWSWLYIRQREMVRPPFSSLRAVQYTYFFFTIENYTYSNLYLRSEKGLWMIQLGIMDGDIAM